MLQLGAGEAAREMHAATPKGHQPTTRAEALQGHYRADQRLVSAFFRRGLPGGVRVGLVVSGFVGLEMAISHARGTIDWRNGLGAGFATGLLYSAVGTAPSPEATGREREIALTRSPRGGVALPSPGRVGRQGGVQLFALSTVCGLLYGLAQDARIALDAARQAQAPPAVIATPYAPSACVQALLVPGLIADRASRSTTSLRANAGNRRKRSRTASSRTCRRAWMRRRRRMQPHRRLRPRLGARLYSNYDTGFTQLDR